MEGVAEPVAAAPGDPAVGRMQQERDTPEELHTVALAALHTPAEASVADTEAEQVVAAQTAVALRIVAAVEDTEVLEEKLVGLDHTQHPSAAKQSILSPHRTCS